MLRQAHHRCKSIVARSQRYSALTQAANFKLLVQQFRAVCTEISLFKRILTRQANEENASIVTPDFEASYRKLAECAVAGDVHAFLTALKLLRIPKIAADTKQIYYDKSKHDKYSQLSEDEDSMEHFLRIEQLPNLASHSGVIMQVEFTLPPNEPEGVPVVTAISEYNPGSN